MDERRGSGRNERSAWTRMAVLLLAVMALAVGACGSSDSGAGKADTSGPDDPSPTSSSDADDASTTAPPGGGEPSTAANGGDPDCGLLSEYLLQPAVLSEEDGGDPVPEPPSMSSDEEMALARSIGEQFPPELAARWNALMDLAEDLSSGTEPASDAEADAAVEDLSSVFDDATVWAARQCPDLPPMWRCSTRAKFTPVGKALNQDGTVEPMEEDEGVADPDDLLADVDDGDQAVVLDESSSSILWGWLDDDGMVIRTVQADVDGGRWRASSPTECRGDEASSESGDDGFEVIGEEIED